MTLGPDATLAEAHSIMARFHIFGVAVVEGGDWLVWLLTSPDIRFCADGGYAKPVDEFMTSAGLITAAVGTTLEVGKDILHQYRIEKLPLVEDMDGSVGSSR